MHYLMLRTHLMRYLTLLLCSAALFFLSGCQELRGPQWSADGQHIAYTDYVFNPAGGLDTSLYLLEAETEAAKPLLLAKDGAFPQWSTDGPTLYYLADRDTQGFYTKVYRCKPGTAPQAVLSNLRATNLQLSADGLTALLTMGKDSKPGAASTVEVWRIGDTKRTPLTLGELYSPALLPTGRIIAYTQKAAASLPLVFVCDIAVAAGAKLEPQAVFPTDKFNEPNAANFIIHAFPDSSRFLLYAPGGANIWTVSVPRGGGEREIKRYALPEGLSTPVLVAIAEDGDSATLTSLQPGSERFGFQVSKLDFKSSRFIRIESSDGPDLIGGHMADPRTRRKGEPRFAWLSAAGLAIGDAKLARYNPLTVMQYATASGIYGTKLNDTATGLTMAQKARDLAGLGGDAAFMEHLEFRANFADKKYGPAGEAFERYLLLTPVGRDGLHFLFPTSSGLPRPAPSEIDALDKELEELIKVLPENRLLPLLRQAYVARSQGKNRQALAFYKEAIPICADEARAGGVRFQEAMAAFEAGDLLRAGEAWDTAARSAQFPQADFAAGLSAIAYMLDGRADAPVKATAALQAPAAKASPLSAEISQLSTTVRGKPFRDSSKSKEILSADQTVRAWVEIDIYSMPFASLKPVRIFDKAGKPIDRRIGIKPVTVSSIALGGLDQPIFRVPRAITQPVIAPNSTLMAFSVHGEVFPLEDTFCDVLVIDTRGRLILGNNAARLTGKFSGRNIVKTIEWSGPLNLKVTGTEIDFFGAEKPFTRTLTVPATLPAGAAPVPPAAVGVPPKAVPIPVAVPKP